MQTNRNRDNCTLARCRYGPLGWLLVLIFGGMCGLIIGLTLFAPHAGRTADDVEMTIFDAVLLVPILIFAVYLVRAQVIADEVGLRWRGLGGWREARWDDVTDFYEKPAKRNNTEAALNVIETSAGTILVSTSGAWTQTSTLRDVVAQRATQAPSRTWAERGKRTNEMWPYIFTYDTRDNRVLRTLMPTLGLLLIACYVAMFLPKFARNVAEMGWAWELGMIGLFGLVMLFPLLGVIDLLVADRDTCRRRRERIVVTQEEIAWENGDLRLAAPWKEVQEFQTVRSGPRLTRSYIVITRRGKFDFTSRIDEPRLLQTLIERYAPEAVARGRRTIPDEENLLPHRGTSLTGERIYHYRTRSARAILWIPGTLAVCFATLPELNKLGWIPPPSKDSGNPMIFATTSAIITLLGWWWYRRACVRTDTLGITQETPLGKRFIFWGDVQDYYQRDSTGYVIGSNTRIGFSVMIADMDDLKAEIKQRAAQSRSRDWTRKR